MRTLIALLIGCGIPAFPAAVTITWGGPVRLATMGMVTDGDTWYSATGPGPQIYGTFNDGYGAALGCHNNIGLVSISPDVRTYANVNCMTGFGGAGINSIGICSSSESVKSSGIVAYNNKLIWPIHCQLNFAPWSTSNESLIISPTDDPAGAGKHWFRTQDSYTIGAASCTAGTVTLTTAAQALAVGDLVMVSGVNPVGYNGTFTAIAGTTSTAIKYATTCPAAYVSGGVVLGPGSANGTPPSVVSWPGVNTRMTSEKYIQYCANNVGCATSVDSSNLYLNGLSQDGGYVLSYAFRVLKSDVDNFPGDATKYQRWTGGASFGSTLASATPIQCIVGGVSSNCSGGPYSITYITDSLLTDGGVYLLAIAGDAGQELVGWSDHFYGPFTLTTPQPQTPLGVHNPATTFGWPDPIAGSYHRTNTAPYQGVITLQFSSTPDYAAYQQDILIANALPASAQPSYGTASRYKHIQLGLHALWQFGLDNDLTTLKDSSPGGNYSIPMSASTGSTKAARISMGGFENDNPAGAAPEVMSIPTGFAEDLTDFTVMLVAQSTFTINECCQMLLDSTADATAGFQVFVTPSPNNLTLAVRGWSGGLAVTCPGVIPANTFFAYAMGKKAGNTFCFQMGNATPGTGTGPATSLGAYSLMLGNEIGQTRYVRGTIGEIAIWNRALCSTQIPGSCAPGQTDEVQQEFGVVKAESRYRGWGF